MKFTRLAPVFVLAIGLALTGCGKKQDDGIATASNGSKPSGAPVATDPKEQARQFAQCMRDQGIDMPDPTFGDNGEVTTRVGPGEKGGEGPGEPARGMAPNEDRAKFETAMKACQQYMPSGGELGAMDPEAEEKMRQFAKCMRENGIEDFPDPQTGGGIIIGGGTQPGGGINPSSPEFQAAQKKCEELLPKRKAGAAS